MQDPSHKYRDQVDLNHRMAMDAVSFSFQLLEPHTGQIQAFLEAERQSHSIGMVLDPTLYRDQIYSRNFARQIRMANAALAFIREIGAIRNDIAAEAVLPGNVEQPQLSGSSPPWPAAFSSALPQVSSWRDRSPRTPSRKSSRRFTANTGPGRAAN